MPYTLVLIRHGQSTWNLENRFTGWTDVDLTELGRREARSGAEAIKAAGLTFDAAHTSVLKRAIKTLWIVLEALEIEWVPVQRAWELNERHYGALQGLNKTEMAGKYGEAQVKIWRRSYAIPPPALDTDDPRHPRFDRRYAGLTPEQLPHTEALRDTVARMAPYWKAALAPAVASGQRLLIAAHGNSIRALVKYLDHVSDEAITELNIPTGIPLVYELDGDLSPIRSYYLGDPEAVKQAAEAVANQSQTRR